MLQEPHSYNKKIHLNCWFTPNNRYKFKVNQTSWFPSHKSSIIYLFHITAKRSSKNKCKKLKFSKSYIPNHGTSNIVSDEEHIKKPRRFNQIKYSTRSVNSWLAVKVICLLLDPRRKIALQLIIKSSGKDIIWNIHLFLYPLRGVSHWLRPYCIAKYCEMWLVCDSCPFSTISSCLEKLFSSS